MSYSASGEEAEAGEVDLISISKPTLLHHPISTY
jgi:hypothetical protein